MLPKQYRFHGYGSLKFLHSHGRMVRSRFMGLKYIANPRRKDSRLSIVVAKKVTKKAPTRNRIRRRLYAAMSAQWPLVKPGNDILLTVFEEQINQLTPAELTRLVVSLLKKADLYK